MAIGCEKCYAFKVCPLKSTIGDYKQPAAAPAPPPKKTGREAKAKR
jgi:hypothetical protein